MFYSAKDLQQYFKRGGRLYPIWIAAHGMQSLLQEEPVDTLIDMCADIAWLLHPTATQPRLTPELRLTSLLVSGATRTLATNADALLEDTEILFRQMSTANHDRNSEHTVRKTDSDDIKDLNNNEDEKSSLHFCRTNSPQSDGRMVEYDDSQSIQSDIESTVQGDSTIIEEEHDRNTEESDEELTANEGENRRTPELSEKELTVVERYNTMPEETCGELLVVEEEKTTPVKHENNLILANRESAEREDAHGSKSFQHDTGYITIEEENTSAQKKSKGVSSKITNPKRRGVSAEKGYANKQQCQIDCRETPYKPSSLHVDVSTPFDTSNIIEALGDISSSLCRYQSDFEYRVESPESELQESALFTPPNVSRKLEGKSVHSSITPEEDTINPFEQSLEQSRHFSIPSLQYTAQSETLTQEFNVVIPSATTHSGSGSDVRPNSPILPIRSKRYKSNSNAMIQFMAKGCFTTKHFPITRRQIEEFVMDEYNYETLHRRRAIEVDSGEPVAKRSRNDDIRDPISDEPDDVCELIRAILRQAESDFRIRHNIDSRILHHGMETDEEVHQSSWQTIEDDSTNLNTSMPSDLEQSVRNLKATLRKGYRGYKTAPMTRRRRNMRDPPYKRPTKDVTLVESERRESRRSERCRTREEQASREILAADIEQTDAITKLVGTSKEHNSNTVEHKNTSVEHEPVIGAEDLTGQTADTTQISSAERIPATTAITSAETWDYQSIDAQDQAMRSVPESRNENLSALYSMPSEEFTDSPIRYFRSPSYSEDIFDVLCNRSEYDISKFSQPDFPDSVCLLDATCENMRNPVKTPENSCAFQDQAVGSPLQIVRSPPMSHVDKLFEILCQQSENDQDKMNQPKFPDTSSCDVVHDTTQIFWDQSLGITSNNPLTSTPIVTRTSISENQQSTGQPQRVTTRPEFRSPFHRGEDPVHSVVEDDYAISLSSDSSEDVDCNVIQTEALVHCSRTDEDSSVSTNGYEPSYNEDDDPSPSSGEHLFHINESRYEYIKRLSVLELTPEISFLRKRSSQLYSKVSSTNRENAFLQNNDNLKNAYDREDDLVEDLQWHDGKTIERRYGYINGPSVLEPIPEVSSSKERDSSIDNEASSTNRESGFLRKNENLKNAFDGEDGLLADLQRHDAKARENVSVEEVVEHKLNEENLRKLNIYTRRKQLSPLATVRLVTYDSSSPESFSESSSSALSLIRTSYGPTEPCQIDLDETSYQETLHRISDLGLVPYDSSSSSSSHSSVISLGLDCKAIIYKRGSPDDFNNNLTVYFKLSTDYQLNKYVLQNWAHRFQ